MATATFLSFGIVLAVIAIRELRALYASKLDRWWYSGCSVLNLLCAFLLNRHDLAAWWRGLH
jgi:hypothetical protein